MNKKREKVTSIKISPDDIKKKISSLSFSIKESKNFLVIQHFI